MSVKDVVKETILQVIENDEAKNHIESSDDLSSIGLNSVSFIEIVVILEKKFHIKFKNEDLDYKRFTSLEFLCKYISEQVIGNCETSSQS